MIYNMDNTKWIYRAFVIFTILFIMAVAYGTYYTMKIDKERLEKSK